jgi:hypothetical protein
VCIEHINHQNARGNDMRRITNYGGVAASIILILFGAGALIMGINGRSTVNDSLKKEQIVGTPDMSPTAIKAEVAKAGLKNVSIPSSSVAGKSIDTASEARTFAEYMRIHTLLATGGQVYAQMPRFLDKNGKPTENEKAAAVDPKSGRPVENQARNIWVNETALSTALNTSYFAQQVSMFAIVIGIALLLTGVGFGVVTLRLLVTRKEEHPETVRPAEAAAAPAV